MISAVVFTPETWTGADLIGEREVVVRSLVWLVSAVVSGVVRDVTLAVPAGLGLGEVADQSGCALVQGESEAERLAAAIEAAREPRLIVLKAGFQPEAGIIGEIDGLIRREARETIAYLLAAPRTPFQRLFPQRAAVVGTLMSQAAARSSQGAFQRLAREARRRGLPLHATARPIV